MSSFVSTPVSVGKLVGRAAMLLALLSSEYLFIALNFDGVMHRYEGPWQHLTDFVTFSALGFAGLMVLSGRSLLHNLRGELGMLAELPGVGRPLLWHGLGFAGFLGCVVALAGLDWSRASFGAVVLLSLALGGLSALGLATAALPWAALRRLGYGLRMPLFWGLISGVAAYLVGYGASFLWEGLAAATLTLSGGLLSAMGFVVYVDPTLQTLQVESFAVDVAKECSGLEGMGLIAVFVTLYLWTARRRLWMGRALWMLPVGLLCMYAANLLRIALLVVIGARISPAVALGGFHSKAGWLFFCAVALGIVGLTASIGWLQRPDGTPDGPDGATKSDGASRHAVPAQAALTGPFARESGANPTADYLMPLLSLIAVSLVTGLGTPTGFDVLYGARVLAVGVSLWIGRAMLRDLGRRVSMAGPLAGVVAFGLWMWLADVPAASAHADVADGLASLSSWGVAVWLTLRVLGSVVAVPVAEELAFRGFALRRVTALHFEKVPLTQVSWPGLAVSSFAFGILHSDYVAGTVVGVVYGLTVWRRGNLWDAVIAHGVTNALLCIYVLYTGHYGYW